MKHFTKMQLEKTKSKDPVTVIKSLVGTFLILLSGCVLYADKVIDYYDIQIDYNFKYYSSLDVFIWTLSGTIAPLLIIIAYWFKPQKWALAVPIAAYAVQFMYIFYDEDIVSKNMFWYYTIAFIIFFYLLIFLINSGIKIVTHTINSLTEKIRFLVNLITVQAEKKNLIVDDEKWNTEIIKPALKKLDE